MTDSQPVAGHEKAYCEAKTRGGGPCRRPAGWGTDHLGIGKCKLHGGATPNHSKAAADEKVRRLRALYAPVPIVDPSGRMAEVTAEIDALYRAVRDHLTGYEIGEWATDANRPHVVLLRELLSLMRSFLSDWQRLGMEERMVRLDERRAALVCAVLEATLLELDLGDRLPHAREVVGAKLLELAA